MGFELVLECKPESTTGCALDIQHTARYPAALATLVNPPAD